MSSRTNAEEGIEFKTVTLEIDRQTLELDEAPRASLEDEAQEPTEGGRVPPEELRIALNRPVALASVQAEAQARKLKIASQDTHVGPSGVPPGSTVVR